MRLFLADVVVTDDAVEMHGYSDGPDPTQVCVIVGNFSPELFLRLSRELTAAELAALAESLAENERDYHEDARQNGGGRWLRDVFQSGVALSCVNREKLNYFTCDSEGRRHKHWFLALRCVSKFVWKQCKRTPQVNTIRNALGKLTPPVEIEGDVHDGVGNYPEPQASSDGRVCGGREGSGLRELSHQFLRQRGLKCSTWIECPGATVTTARKFQDKITVYEIAYNKLAASDCADVPRFPIASWDIECLNTLSLEFSTNDFFVAEQHVIVSVAGKNKYRVRCVSHRSNCFVKFTVPALLRGQASKHGVVKVGHGGRAFEAEAGKDFVLEVPPGGLEVTCNKRLLDFDRKTVFYFREFQAQFNRDSVAALLDYASECWSSPTLSRNPCIGRTKDLRLCVSEDDGADVLAVGPDSGPIELQAFAKRIGEHKRLSIGLTVHFAALAPEHEALLPRPTRYTTVDRAPAADGVDVTVTFSDVLRFNEIPSPLGPYNEIIMVSWVESMYPDPAPTRRVCLTSSLYSVAETAQTADQDRRTVRDEKSLLRRLMTLWKESQALVVMGYNTHMFDTDYVLNRMRKYFDTTTVQDQYALALSPYTEHKPRDRGRFVPTIKYAESAGKGQTEYCRFETPCRFDVDVYVWFRSQFPPKKKNGDAVQQKLDTVAEHFLGDKKLDVAFNEINRQWFNPEASVLRGHVADYCVQDSALVTRLACCSKVNLIEYNLSLSTVMNVGLRLMPLTNTGEMARLEPFLHHAAHARGIVVDQADWKQMAIAIDDELKKYEGGLVFKPDYGEHGTLCTYTGGGDVPGGADAADDQAAAMDVCVDACGLTQLHDWLDAIFILDFKSLYPSAMRAFNICWYSFVKRGFIVKGCERIRVVCKALHDPTEGFVTVAVHCPRAGLGPGEGAVVADGPFRGLACSLDSSGDRKHLVVPSKAASGEIFCALPAVIDLKVSEPRNDRFVSVYVQTSNGNDHLIGLLPERLRRMNEHRSAVRASAKDAPPEMRNSIESKQLAIKLCANAQYGMIAPATMNPCIPMSAAVTFNARAMLVQAKEFAESQGFKLIYGDTDSIFIKYTPELRARKTREILARAPPDVARQPASDAEARDYLQLAFPGQARNLWDFVVAQTYADIEAHAEEQTKRFPAPNELEFENVLLKAEFFKDVRKCYVGLAIESPRSSPFMYYKGVTCRKSDCIEISRQVQRVVYITKCDPAQLTGQFPGEQLEPFEMCGRILDRMLAPLMASCYDGAFYDWCEQNLIQSKAYKRESSYADPDTMPSVRARRMVEEHCATMACAIGDRQPFLILRAASASDGAIDPRLFRAKQKGSELDKMYYLTAIWKGLKGGDTKFGPGHMNVNTYAHLKSRFEVYRNTIVGQRGLAGLGFATRKREFYEREFEQAHTMKQDRLRKRNKESKKSGQRSVTDFFKR